jgi:hypothetical protein
VGLLVTRVKVLKMSGLIITRNVEDIRQEEVMRLEARQEVFGRSRLLKEGKAIILRTLTFMDFKKALEDTFDSGSIIILAELGKGYGRRSCNRLIHKYPRRGKLLKAITRCKRNEGWGNIKFEIDLENGSGKVIVTESFEAKHHAPSQHPVCHFIKGYLEGTLCEAFGKKLRVTEIQCVAKGGQTCIFQVDESQ